MDLLQGTLDMMVLRTLLFGPLHGYGIAKAIHSSSDQTLDIEFGSLYPALKRLEVKGWVASKWETSEYKSARKKLSAHGRGAETAHTGTFEMGGVRGVGIAGDGTTSERGETMN
jgi:PadR family transcriptional regulator PadR